MLRFFEGGVVSAAASDAPAHFLVDRSENAAALRVEHFDLAVGLRPPSFRKRTAAPTSR